MSALLQNQRIYQTTSRRPEPPPPQPPPQAPTRFVHRSSTESSNIIRLDRERSGDSKSIKSVSEISCQIRDIELGIKQAVREKNPYIKKVRKSLKTAYRKLGIKHLLPFLVITIYSFVGAAIFIALERPTDVNERQAVSQHIKHTRFQVVQKIEEIYVDGAFVNLSRRGNELWDLLLYYEQEIGFSFREETVWTLINAMYYCGTLYTTIGYGNIWPTTTGGRVFTMVYAVMGIPIVLTCLSDLGRVLFLSIHRVIVLFDIHIARRWRRWRRNRELAKKSTKSAKGKRGSQVSSAIFRSSTKDAPLARVESTDSKDEEKLLFDEKMGVSFDEAVEDQQEQEELDEFERQRRTIMRIPVSVALAVTLSWIFLCAGLFCIWERNWTYFTSIYFIFISLSTIGLGDVTPDYPEYMIAVFYLVIIGLSLVSMCINVIQHRLREIFMQLLMKVLLEYQQQLKSGQDQVGAATGMAQAWNKNATAKFLMPLLSNTAKQNVVKEFQEEAKSKGLDFPPILDNVDPDTGLPAILAVAKESDKETHDLEKEIAHLLQQSAKPLLYELGVQTEVAVVSRESETDQKFTCDMETQYEIDFNAMETQTEAAIFTPVEIQTSLELCEQMVQTDCTIDFLTCSMMQTESVSQQEFGLQFYPDLMTSSTQMSASLRTMEVQTDFGRAPMMTQTSLQMVTMETQTVQAETSNKRIETDPPSTADADVQISPVTECGFCQAIVDTDNAELQYEWEVAEVNCQTELIQMNNAIVQTDFFRYLLKENKFGVNSYAQTSGEEEITEADFIVGGHHVTRTKEELLQLANQEALLPRLAPPTSSCHVQTEHAQLKSDWSQTELEEKKPDLLTAYSQTEERILRMNFTQTGAESIEELDEGPEAVAKFDVETQTRFYLYQTSTWTQTELLSTRRLSMQFEPGLMDFARKRSFGLVSPDIRPLEEESSPESEEPSRTCLEVATETYAPETSERSTEPDYDIEGPAHAGETMSRSLFDEESQTESSVFTVANKKVQTQSVLQIIPVGTAEKSKDQKDVPSSPDSISSRARSLSPGGSRSSSRSRAATALQEPFWASRRASFQPQQQVASRKEIFEVDDAPPPELELASAPTSSGSGSRLGVVDLKPELARRKSGIIPPKYADLRRLSATAAASRPSTVEESQSTPEIRIEGEPETEKGDATTGEKTKEGKTGAQGPRYFDKV